MQICGTCKGEKYLQNFQMVTRNLSNKQANVTGWATWAAKYDRGGERGAAEGMESFGEPPHRRKKSIMGCVAHVALMTNENEPKQSRNHIFEGRQSPAQHLTLETTQLFYHSLTSNIIYNNFLTIHTHKKCLTGLILL